MSIYNVHWKGADKMNMSHAAIILATVMLLGQPTSSKPVESALKTTTKVVRDEKTVVVKQFITAVAHSDIGAIRKCYLPTNSLTWIEKAVLASDTGINYISKTIAAHIDDDVSISTMIEYKGDKVTLLFTDNMPCFIQMSPSEDFHMVPDNGEFAYMRVGPVDKKSGVWQKLPKEFSDAGFVVALKKHNGKWRVDVECTDLTLRSYSKRLIRGIFSGGAPTYGLIEPDDKNLELNKWIPNLPGIDTPLGDGEPKKSPQKQP